MRATFALVPISIVTAAIGQAWADGPSPSMLQAQMASGPTINAASREQARALAAEAQIGQAASTASAIAIGAVQAAGGNAGGVTVQPAIAGASNARSLATRFGERPSVADFAANGTAVAGAISTVLLSAQAAGSRQITIASIPSLQTGAIVAATSLPAGTLVNSIGATSPVTTTQTTNSTTLTAAEQQAAATMSGLPNQMQFASVFSVPVGAAISGAGIAAGTQVVGVSYPAAGGTLVYGSTNAVADIASGTVVGFAYSATTVSLSAAWSAAAAAGTAIGIAIRDDALAFQSAAFYSAPENGGTGGRIFVPSGSYYLSHTISTYNGVSFELGPQVTFVPGSASIDTADSGFASTAEYSIFGGYRNPTATTVNISQNVYQGNMPSLQGQALLVNQTNVNCTNDGSITGCGIVAQEVKQIMAANITRGTLWGYHETDGVTSGQSVTWSGAEIELQNSSGKDVVWNSIEGSKTGLHIDDIGNTMNSVVLLPGGDIQNTGGGWHRAVDCPVIAVSDYCFDIQTGPLTAGTGAPVILAGLDMTGKYTGTALAIPGTASVGGALTVGSLRAAGSSVSAPTATSYTILSSDCGTTLEPAATAATSITVPTGLPIGCRIDVNEVGNYAVSFQAGSGMTMRAYGGATKILGNYASAKLLVDSASSFLLSGQIQ